MNASIRYLCVLIIAVCLFPACTSDDGSITCYSSTNYQGSLVEVINRYREENGLPTIPVSPALTYVAEYHVYDLSTNSPYAGDCNLHSWSDKGHWTPCCYKPDNGSGLCMLDKPRELTEYTGDGFEIAAQYSITMTPNCALESWRNSPSHHDVILNRGKWADYEWKAVGVAMSKYYAVVWFGAETDYSEWLE